MMMDMFYDRVREQGVASHRAHFHDFMLDMNKSLQLGRIYSDFTIQQFKSQMKHARYMQRV